MSEEGKTEVEAMLAVCAASVWDAVNKVLHDEKLVPKDERDIINRLIWKANIFKPLVAAAVEVYAPLLRVALPDLFEVEENEFGHGPSAVRREIEHDAEELRRGQASHAPLSEAER